MCRWANVLYQQNCRQRLTEIVFSSRICITKKDESHSRNQITILYRKYSNRYRVHQDLSCRYFWRCIISNFLHNNKIQFSIAPDNILTRNFYFHDLLNSTLTRKGFKDFDHNSRELLIERVLGVY